MSTAISYDPNAAAEALLAEQTERERVIRDLAASYGDLLEHEQALDKARTTHVQLRQRAAEFGITDSVLKKAGINTVGSPTKRTTRRTTKRAAAPDLPRTENAEHQTGH